MAGLPDCPRWGGCLSQVSSACGAPGRAVLLRLRDLESPTPIGGTRFGYRRTASGFVTHPVSCGHTTPLESLPYLSARPPLPRPSGCGWRLARPRPPHIGSFRRPVHRHTGSGSGFSDSGGDRVAPVRRNAHVGSSVIFERRGVNNCASPRVGVNNSRPKKKGNQWLFQSPGRPALIARCTDHVVTCESL